LLLHDFAFAQLAGQATVNGYGAGAQNANGAAIGSLLTNGDENAIRTKNRVENFVGSPYTNDTFKASKLFYGDELQGIVYYRYNAFNEEIEIKEILDPEAPVRGLLKDKSISILDPNNKSLTFRTFIDKKKNTLNGYLIVLEDGQNFTLYKRINVKYSEGTPSPNSFVKATPNRFSHFQEYYLEKKGDNKIVEVQPKKRRLLKLMEDEYKDQLDNYLSESKVNLKDEQELINTIQFLNDL